METATRYKYVNVIVLQGYIARRPIFKVGRGGLEAATFYIDIEREKGEETKVQSFKCETYAKQAKETLNVIDKGQKKAFVRCEGRLVAYVKKSKYGKVKPQTRFVVEKIINLVITPFLLVDYVGQDITIDTMKRRELKNERNIDLQSEKSTRRFNKEIKQ